jgi:hypothetical protein
MVQIPTVAYYFNIQKTKKLSNPYPQYLKDISPSIIGLFDTWMGTSPQFSSTIPIESLMIISIELLFNESLH